jgi:hypothetical protein
LQYRGSAVLLNVTEKTMNLKKIFFSTLMGMATTCTLATPWTTDFDKQFQRSPQLDEAQSVLGFTHVSSCLNAQILFQFKIPCPGLQSETLSHFNAAISANLLRTNDWIRTTKLASPRFTLVLQIDGNLVVYDDNGVPQWHSDTYDRARTPRVAVTAEMQEDGNFVLYDAQHSAVAHTGTDRFNKENPVQLSLDPAGCLILQALGSGKTIWSRCKGDPAGLIQIP